MPSEPIGIPATAMPLTPAGRVASKRLTSDIGHAGLALKLAARRIVTHDDLASQLRAHGLRPLLATSTSRIPVDDDITGRKRYAGHGEEQQGDE